MFRSLAERTKELYINDNKNPEKFLDFGPWTKMAQATLGLDVGVFLIAAVPNVGKSMMLLNIYCNLLKYNSKIFVLDFSLDDSFEDRSRSAIARLAKIPINWVKLPQGIPDTAKDARNKAFRNWAQSYIPSLQIIDETDFGGKASYLSVMKMAITKTRESLPDDIKLVVIVDGFHNITVDEIHGDKLEKQVHLSQQLKSLMTETKSIMFASTHVPKSNIRRNMDWTAVSGAGDIGYDAKIIATIYSDVAVNKGTAEVFHQAVLDHCPGVTLTLPVIELDVVKNKASSFKDIIFYKLFPEYAYVEEAPEQYQVAWRKQIYEGAMV